MVLKLTLTNGNSAKEIQINNAAVKYLNDTAFSKTLSKGVPIVVRYDGSKYIYDEIELATMNNAGTVQLGASKVAGLTTTPTAANTTGRYYPVQTDNNNRLVVNVPWESDTDTHYTAEVVVGGSNATANASSQTDPFIRVLDKNGSTVIKDSDVQLKGSGLVSISSANNVITVSASHPTGDEYNHVPAVTANDNNKILQASYNSNGVKSLSWVNKPSYAVLSATNKSAMYGYLVKGASGLADDTHFLTGAGNWREVIATVPRLQDISGSNPVSGSATGSTPAEGQLKVSSPQQFKMIKVSTYHKVSSVPDTVVFFGDSTLKSEITITVSNLNVHRFSQTSDSDWIVQVEAIGGNVYIAPIYYRFYVSSSSWRAVAL